MRIEGEGATKIRPEIDYGLTVNKTIVLLTLALDAVPQMIDAARGL